MMKENSNDDFDREIKVIKTGCCHDCGGRCALRAHVKDGKLFM